MTATVSPKTRRYDLDWLRVLAILAVFIFHSSRFFDTGDWHVKNATTYFGVQVWVTFLANWLMPLIFVISGASVYLALHSRSGAGRFVVAKAKRLLVPLIVGIFSHVMLGVYLERITNHQFSGSFFDFVPHYFDGLYGFGGNFAWMGLHLWYLQILFVVSLLCYPLFRALLSVAGRRVLDRFGRLLALPGAAYALGLPVAYSMVALDPNGFAGMRAFGGWPLPIYLLFFLYGFVIISNEELRQRLQQQRWLSLGMGALGIAALMLLWAAQGDPTYGSPRYAQVYGIFGVSSWCWILAFYGFASRHLTRSTPFLAYANVAVMPFYVMHQTVLLVIGYYVTRWPIPDLAKWAIIAASAFVSIVILYEFVIRRINVLRVLFGMKPQAQLPHRQLKRARLHDAQG